MNIIYEIEEGKVIEIEVADEIGELVIEIDNKSYNINRKETRRHVSLNMMQEVGIQFEDEKGDVTIIVEEIDLNDRLYKAIDRLLPSQKKLIEDVYIEEKSIVSIAKEEEVTEAAIRNRLKKIYKKLKNILS